jgi:hypothetical protein
MAKQVQSRLVELHADQLLPSTTSNDLGAGIDSWSTFTSGGRLEYDPGNPVTFDVEETRSLISPFQGTLKFGMVLRGKAAGTHSSGRFVSAYAVLFTASERVEAAYSLSEGQWSLTDVRLVTTDYRVEAPADSNLLSQLVAAKVKQGNQTVGSARHFPPTLKVPLILLLRQPDAFLGQPSLAHSSGPAGDADGSRPTATRKRVRRTAPLDETVRFYVTTLHWLEPRALSAEETTELVSLQPLSTQMTIRGYRDGEVVVMDKQRRLKEAGSYRRGKKNGFWLETVSYTDPARGLIGNYRDGRRDGLWVACENSSSKPICSVDFRNGEMRGFRLVMDNEGRVAVIGEVGSDDDTYHWFVPSSAEIAAGLGGRWIVLNHGEVVDEGQGPPPEAKRVVLEGALTKQNQEIASLNKRFRTFLVQMGLAK